MFCPTCDTLLAPSEEDDKLMEKCSMCGFKKENDKIFTYDHFIYLM